MIKMTKDGITKYVPENEIQKYEEWGFKRKSHKPEPMILPKEAQKTKDTQKDTKEDK